MKLIDVAGYIGEESRQTERVVAIAMDVSAADWANMPSLGSEFFQDCEVSLTFMPIGTRGQEVWMVAVSEVDLDRAASFVAGFVSGMHGDGR